MITLVFGWNKPGDTTGAPDGTHSDGAGAAILATGLPTSTGSSSGSDGGTGPLPPPGFAGRPRVVGSSPLARSYPSNLQLDGADVVAGKLKLNGVLSRYKKFKFGLFDYKSSRTIQV